MLEIDRAGELAPLLADMQQVRRSNVSRSAAELAQEAMDQSLDAPRWLGEASLSAAQIAEINRLDRPKSFADQAEEVLNQLLKPSQQIGEENFTASRIADFNQLNQAESLKDLVKQALNQTAGPPRQIGLESRTAAQIAELNRLNQPTGIDDLIKEVLNQTLANPKLSISQLAKNVKQTIPTLQRVLDSLDKLRNKMEQMEVKIKDMQEGLPFNNYLSRMREEVMAEFHVIDAITEARDFAGNKLLSQEGKPFQIALPDGSYMEILAEDLRLGAAEEDLLTQQTIEALLPQLREKLDQISGYQMHLMPQMDQLAAEVKRVELELNRDLGVDLSGMNANLAAEMAVLLANEAVKWTMKESLDARQVHGLLKNPVY